MFLEPGNTYFYAFLIFHRKRSAPAVFIQVEFGALCLQTFYVVRPRGPGAGTTKPLHSLHNTVIREVHEKNVPTAGSAWERGEGMLLLSTG